MAKVHDVTCLDGNKFKQLLGGWVVAAADLNKQRGPHQAKAATYCCGAGRCITRYVCRLIACRFFGPLSICF